MPTARCTERRNAGSAATSWPCSERTPPDTRPRSPDPSPVASWLMFPAWPSPDGLFMTEHTSSVAAAKRHTGPRVSPWLILGSVGFVLLYLCTDVMTSKLASSALPLPNVPAEEARAWFAANPGAAVMMGVCQLLSVACLAAAVYGLRLAATGRRQAAACRRARPWGLAAVALMACSSVLTWVLAAVAPTASAGVAGALRTASFITGGTAHVVTLGLFVLLASRIPGFGKVLRV